MSTSITVVCYKSKTLSNGEHLEKPRDFDPFGHAGLSPLVTI